MKAKKLLAMLLCASMVLSNVSMAAPGANEKPETTQATHTYPDSANSWAAASIERWSAAGVMKGDQNGNFNHTAKLSCAELAQIFVNMFGLTVKAENTFADLKGDEWYADAVLKCVAAGILKGDGTNINAKRFVSRQETMVMFGRAVGIAPAAKPDLSKFTDAASVAAWAAGYLAPLAEMGIISGSGDGTINAVGEIDRASTASLLDKSIAFYITAPGEYKAQDSKRFVVVNASAKAGEVIISGTAAGVIVAAGTGNAKVLGRDLKADTFKVDGIAPVLLEGNSTVGDLVANATGTIGIASGATVNRASANAAAAIANSGNIKVLVANAPVAVDNKGTIGTAEVKASGVVLGGTRPIELNVAQGTKNPTNSAGQEIKPVAPVTPPTNSTVEDDYVAVAPKISIEGSPRAFLKTTLFKEDKNGMITDFSDANSVVPFTPVTLKKGDYNYNNVRLVMETTAENKGKFQAIAFVNNDTSAAAYSVLTAGWGGSEGFKLEDQTILIYMMGTVEGNYPITIKLVDMKNNAVIASTSVSVPVINIGENQAIIGTKSYEGIEEALVAAQPGDSVELLATARIDAAAIVKKDVILRVLHGTKLTVPEGVTLDLEGTVANDGTIINGGTMNLVGETTENGNVINMNTFINNGTIEIAASGAEGFESYQNVFMNMEKFTSTGIINNGGNFATGLRGVSTLSSAASTMKVEAGGTTDTRYNGKMIVATGAIVNVAPEATLSVDETGTMNIDQAAIVVVEEGGKLVNEGQIEIASGEIGIGDDSGKITIASGKLVVGNADAPPPEGETTFVPTLSNAEKGSIINKGTIENYCGFKNDGDLINGEKNVESIFPTIKNEGDIQNHGVIINYGVFSNCGYSQSEGTNEGYIYNHGIIENYSAINNVGSIFNEDDTPTEQEQADPKLLTEGIVYNRIGGSLINAGDIDIGSEQRYGALINGGILTNVSTGSIYNYDFLLGEVEVSAPGSVPIISNEGEIILGDGSNLTLDIANEAVPGVGVDDKKEGIIVVCDNVNLALAVKMGGIVRMNNDIVTNDTILIEDAVTLDGNNNCLTGVDITGDATLLISGGAEGLTPKVMVKDLIVHGPNTTPDAWDKGEYAVKVYNANDVTLNGVWMIYANAGLQVNSSKVKLMNDICFAADEFGGIEVAKGAGDLGAGELIIDENATIMHISNPNKKPTVWMDDVNAGIITGGETLLTEAELQENDQVYYYLADTTPDVPVELSMPELTINDSYEVNLVGTEPDTLEYEWAINFTCGGQEYQVGTKHFKLGNSKPTTKTVHEMQTNLWCKNDRGSYDLVPDVNVMLEVENGVPKWTFYLPEGITGEIHVKNVSIVVPVQ